MSQSCLSWPHRSLSLWLCPRPAAGTPGSAGPVGAEPTVRGEEACQSSDQQAGGLAVPSSREPRGAPAARPVRPSQPQPPDPRSAGRGAGAAGEGPVHLQLELLRPALREAADGASRKHPRRCCAWLSARCRMGVWEGGMNFKPQTRSLSWGVAGRALGGRLEFLS